MIDTERPPNRPMNQPLARTTIFPVLEALTLVQATIASTLRRFAFVLGFAATLLLSAAPGSAADINVYFNPAAQIGLVGPTGGSGATWNQATAYSGAGLKDASGINTTVGFTTTLTNFAGAGGNSLTLCKHAAYGSKGQSATRQLVINGLTAGKQYDVYLASYFSETNDDKTTFSTANNSATASPQTADNSLGSNAATTWTAGTNYVLFQGVELDASHNITFTIGNSGGAYLILNGFQVVESTVVVTTPAAPVGLTTTAGNQNVSLTWNAVAGATGYNVKRSLTDGGPYDMIGSPAGTAYSDTPLVNGTAYYYVVTATNSAGESLNSTQASTTPTAPPVPDAPTGLSATVGNQGVALAWNLVSGATDYKIMRSLTDGGPYDLIGSSAGDAYMDKSVVSNTTYFYVLSATNSTGEGATSSQISAATTLIVPTLRILPLGDSITNGNGVPGGYRDPLYWLLVNAGFGVDFVGTLSENGVASLPDQDHEGHGGFSISGIDAILANVFSQIETPDVILLHIGTNDFSGGGDAAAPDRLEQLIVHLASQWPLARIVVSNLLERGEPANTAIQTYFNPFLPGIVARQAALGRRVYFTDMRSAVPRSDMPDSLHPNLAGYNKMAGNWFSAISALYPPGGSTIPPVITNVAASSVTSTAAVLNATLSCDAVCDVHAYWGTVNGGTNAALWANSAYVGSRTNVVANGISQAVTGLTPNTTYYFTFRASPGNGPEVWATNVLYFGPSPANDMLTFGLPGLTDVVIDSSSILWTVPNSTDVTTLAPTYTVSALANASPSSGTSRDFTTPQTYSVTAQNGTTKNYLVTVTKAAASTAKDILTFGPGAVIDGSTILWTVPHGADVTNLAPTFTLSPLATATPASGTVGNFNTPQSYTVTAEDHSTKTYQVVVTPSPAPWLNVYLNNTVQTGLAGPAGGAGATWNRNLYSGSDLLDASGSATSVGFSTDLTNDVNGPSSLTLCKYANYGNNNLTEKQLVITGLTAGKQYDVYLASYFTNRDVTTFSTTNTTPTPSPQSADNRLGSNSGTTWIQGTNYVLFQRVQPDANDSVTFSIGNGDGSYRILNGFQLVEVAAPSTPYDSWLAANGKTDTPENLKEYAFGTANTGAIGIAEGGAVTLGQAPATLIDTGGGDVSANVIFGRRRNHEAAGLTYTVEFSTTLGTWYPSTDSNLKYAPGSSGIPVKVGESGDMDVVSVPYPLSVKINGEDVSTGGQGFCRIGVSLPSN